MNLVTFHEAITLSSVENIYQTKITLLIKTKNQLIECHYTLFELCFENSLSILHYQTQDISLFDSRCSIIESQIKHISIFPDNFGSCCQKHTS